MPMRKAISWTSGLLEKLLPGSPNIIRPPGSREPSKHGPDSSQHGSSSSRRRSGDNSKHGGSRHGPTCSSREPSRHGSSSSREAGKHSTGTDIGEATGLWHEALEVATCGGTDASSMTHLPPGEDLPPTSLYYTPTFSKASALSLHGSMGAAGNTSTGTPGSPASGAGCVGARSHRSASVSQVQGEPSRGFGSAAGYISCSSSNKHAAAAHDTLHYQRRGSMRVQPPQPQPQPAGLQRRAMSLDFGVLSSNMSSRELLLLSVIHRVAQGTNSPSRLTETSDCVFVSPASPPLSPSPSLPKPGAADVGPPATAPKSKGPSRGPSRGPSFTSAGTPTASSWHEEMCDARLLLTDEVMPPTGHASPCKPPRRSSPALNSLQVVAGVYCTAAVQPPSSNTDSSETRPVPPLRNARSMDGLGACAWGPVGSAMLSRRHSMAERAHSTTPSLTPGFLTAARQQAVTAEAACDAWAGSALDASLPSSAAAAAAEAAGLAMGGAAAPGAWAAAAEAEAVAATGLGNGTRVNPLYEPGSMAAGMQASRSASCLAHGQPQGHMHGSASAPDIRTVCGSPGSVGTGGHLSSNALSATCVRSWSLGISDEEESAAAAAAAAARAHRNAWAHAPVRPSCMPRMARQLTNLPEEAEEGSGADSPRSPAQASPFVSSAADEGSGAPYSGGGHTSHPEGASGRSQLPLHGLVSPGHAHASCSSPGPQHHHHPQQAYMVPMPAAVAAAFGSNCGNSSNPLNRLSTTSQFSRNSVASEGGTEACLTDLHLRMHELMDACSLQVDFSRASTEGPSFSRPSCEFTGML